MWKYKGDTMSMINNIQWTFTVDAMMDKDHDRLMKIMNNNEKMKQAAEEYGITEMAVAKEMIRLGRKAVQILKDQNDEWSV